MDSNSEIEFDVTHHYDVWGNPEDGWQVNDSSRAGAIRVPVGSSHEDIWNALCAAGIAQGAFQDAEFQEGPSGFCIAEAKGGRPTFALESKGQ